MAFDPTLPATNAPISSSQMRNQLNGLKQLIDNIPNGAVVTAEQAEFLAHLLEHLSFDGDGRLVVADGLTSTNGSVYFGDFANGNFTELQHTDDGAPVLVSTSPVRAPSIRHGITEIVIVNGDNGAVSAPTGYLRITGADLPFSISGFLDCISGKQIFIRNFSVAGGDMTLKHDDLMEPNAFSRILCPGNVDLACTSATLIYDDVAGRWVVIGHA